MGQAEIGVADPGAQRVVNGRWGRMLACGGPRAAGRTDFYVEIALQLTIPAPGGTANAVWIDTGDPGIAACVARVLASIRYPPPVAGAGACP